MAGPRFLYRRHRGRSLVEAIRAEQGYRRRIGLLKLVVPVMAVGIAVSLVMWPMMTDRGGFGAAIMDAGFQGGGRDEMHNPRFVGMDSSSRPYTLTAEVAMRLADGGDEIFLIAPKADIALSGEDWIFVSAVQGLYDLRGESLQLEGDVIMITESGLQMFTEAISVDLRSGSAFGEEPVQGRAPWGHLKSAGFRYQPKGDVFHFPGRPTLVLFPEPSVVDG